MMKGVLEGLEGKNGSGLVALWAKSVFTWEGSSISMLEFSVIRGVTVP